MQDIKKDSILSRVTWQIWMALAACLWRRQKKTSGRFLETAPWRHVDRPGRNDVCRCGSEKKYKRCCWQNDELSLAKKGRLA